MREKILELRKQGKSYKQICEVLGCAKSTVAYHCGKGQKEKTINRTRELRKDNVLLSKVDKFLRPSANYRKRRKTDDEILSTSVALIQSKTSNFKRNGSKHNGKPNNLFTYQTIVELYGEITTCYLTGRKINLKEPRTYSFDHMVPVSKGGKNTLENLGICCREANNGKNDLTVNEFIELCKEVVKHNGYKITRK